MRVRVPDARIILFGSRARGDALRGSGVDLIVASRVFEGVHFTDRASHILRILCEAEALPPVDVDLLCYTLRKFEERSKEIGIVGGGAALRDRAMSMRGPRDPYPSLCSRC